MLDTEIADLISEPDRLIYVSIVSFWEIVIKASLGKLKLSGGLRKIIEANPFEMLPIKVGHFLALERLPWHHHDPFDRLLVAQAREEKLVLLTADKKLDRYRMGCYLA